MEEKSAEERDDIAFSLALLALAGSVDAMGYLRLNRTFVSFMSGNTTHLTIAFVTGNWGHSGRAGLVVAMFVVGAAVGRALALGAGPNGRTVILAVEAALLLLTEILGARERAPLLLLPFAMGLQNPAMHKVGDVTVGLTYVTGTLVKLGEGLTDALAGRASSWASYALMWLALAFGGGLGALAFTGLGVRPFFLAAAAAAGLALVELAALRRARRLQPTVPK